MSACGEDPQRIINNLFVPALDLADHLECSTSAEEAGANYGSGCLRLWAKIGACLKKKQECQSCDCGKDLKSAVLTIRAIRAGSLSQCISMPDVGSTFMKEGPN